MDAKKKRRLYIAAGAISVVAVLGVFAYIQYKRLMDYCISVKKIAINSIGAQGLDFNIWLNFLNKSGVKFTIVSQTYKVYLNDKFITTLSNTSPNVIQPKATSEIGLNVRINPKQLLQEVGLSVFDMLKDFNKTRIKIDMKMRVKLLGITIPVPYVYEDTIQGMMAPSPENKSTENKESEC